MSFLYNDDSLHKRVGHVMSWSRDQRLELRRRRTNLEQGRRLTARRDLPRMRRAAHAQNHNCVSTAAQHTGTGLARQMKVVLTLKQQPLEFSTWNDTCGIIARLT